MAFLTPVLTLTVSALCGGTGLQGLFVFRWCHPGHLMVKKHVCSTDTELLALRLCPYYMPREFSHTVLIAIYIPQSANAAGACDIVHSLPDSRPDPGGASRL